MKQPLIASADEDRAPVASSPRYCSPELFENQARKTPHAVAISGGEFVTYEELNQQANCLAWYLRSLGVGPEIFVALYLERVPRMVAAILGVLKAGGAYVPIDLAYPKERAEFMIDDTSAPIVITQEKFRGTLELGGRRVICIDSDWPTIEAFPTNNPGLNSHSDNAAYVIYTSGSTGKPKGVIVTHHNVLRLLRQTRHWYGFNATDVWPLFHSYAFDVSVWELWGCLLNGGRLVVVPYLMTRSPSDFYELLARERITVLNQTPSAFRQLIWAEETAAVKHPLSLRYVICAGEALELQSLKPWFKRHGDERPKVVNMYGITETTVHSTYRVIRQEDLTNGAGSVIGVPIPDLQIYLVDEDLQPVAKGSPGEICVGGDGVARGYLNRPELNAQRFLPDPFSSEPNARMYRSGDLAQYNSSGELEYLGRMDHQVKIRGFRVELGEIESALNRHPAVRESVVIARETQSGDKRLAAFLVPAGQPPSVSELREAIGKVLPDYMVPAVFIFLKQLPLTTNGKVDRRALPTPDGSRPSLNTEYVAPRSGPEEVLARIWSQVLEIDQVGVRDNFFELGGDSIRCIVVLARARQAGVHLTLAQMFACPTIQELARIAAPVASGSHVSQPFSLVSIKDRNHLPPGAEDAYPISRLQLGMFFRNELTPGSAAYHDVFSYTVRGAFVQEKLARVLDEVVARHPLLRTSFHLANFSEPLQVVHKHVRPEFTLEDASAFDGARQEELAKDWIEREKRRAFDRSTAPLVRFHAQVRGPESFQFFISFHHSCLDGWSLAAVVTEIFQEYASPGSPKQPRDAGVSYRDFIGLECQTTASDEARRFWSDYLNDAPVGLLPRWPESHREDGSEQKRGPELVVEPEVLGGLRRVARDAGVPLKSVLMAAHQRVMGLLFGQTDVVSGLISNGRPEELGAERLVGLFLNAAPLRVSLEGGSWLDLVKSTFAAEQRMLPHRRFPLAEIQKLTGGRPVLETAFDFVHFHVLKNLRSATGLEVRESHYFEANDMTTYTTFMLDVDAANLELHIDYDPTQICRRQVEQMTQYYLATLRAMVANPEARYELFNPLSEAENRLLISDWNQTAQDYARDQCIHELFESRVADTPEATAVVFQDIAVTYDELNSRADIVAQCLRDLGVGPGSLVGLCLERSVEMVAGLLAILKAGGAYVPLDPAYPTERLEFMIQDSGAAFVLANRELAGKLPRQARVVCMENLVTSAPTRTIPASPSPLAPENLAYVIYTSGSTGKPKGVQITHRSVVNLLTSAARTLRLTRSDNLLAVTTLSFDIAALEIFTPLITGGRLTIAARESTGDGAQLAGLIHSTEATVMQATPATWRLLLESQWRGKGNLRVLCGGEALKPSLARDLCGKVAELWNFYGPTETTIWSTAWKVTPGSPVTIGRPLANTEVHILNQHLKPVPVGVIGELYIGGDGLARGYLNRPELTAEKFVRHPFSTDPHRRLYRTGDLARYLPDGQIECLGRTDHQVKIRGFRIEPGEVESVLRQATNIADALVTAREDAFGETRLVGYVVSRNGPIPALVLRDYLKARLPLHMVPAHFVVLPEFPLTPNGKIDHRRLPAAENSAAPLGDFLPPRSEMEEAIAEIWKEVLAIPRVGVNESFFELGGDSLSATRAFARINRRFAASISLSELLDHPTIGTLAPVVARSQGSSREQTIPRQPRSSSR